MPHRLFFPQTRVLIAEDDRINRAALAKQLTLMKCAIAEASNGQEAVNYCLNNAVDLVFMDCSMPIMDGYKATKAIRNSDHKESNSIIIVGLTSRVMPGDRQKCLAAGMNDYLAKPAFAKDLKAILSKWVQPVAI